MCLCVGDHHLARAAGLRTSATPARDAINSTVPEIIPDSAACAESKHPGTTIKSNRDTVFCFDAATGKPIWTHSDSADLGDKYFDGWKLNDSEF